MDTLFLIDFTHPRNIQDTFFHPSCVEIDFLTDTSLSRTTIVLALNKLDAQSLLENQTTHLSSTHLSSLEPVDTYCRNILEP